jgi:hypothetical protein
VSHHRCEPWAGSVTQQHCEPRHRSATQCRWQPTVRRDLDRPAHPRAPSRSAIRSARSSMPAE